VANAAGDCYPVAVFAGSSSTAITCNATNSGFADNLIQQIFPVHAWGKRYLTAPFSNSDDAAEVNIGRFRVAVKDPATVVKRNGVILSSLVDNFYYEFESNTADLIEADKPILVAQYMPSMNDNVSNGGCAYTGLGDPEMIYLSPLEQSIKRVGFYRNTAAVVEVNYLTLVIPTNGLSSLTIDGSNTFSHSYPHPNMPGYTVVVQRWSAAKAQCIVQSDSAFTAITYGMGKYDSYGYNAGTMINNLNGILNLHNVEGAAGAVHSFACRNSPTEISMLMTYQPSRLLWHLSQLAYITPNTDVIQNNPTPVGTVVYKGLTYYKYTLPGTYTFSQADTFRLEVSSTHLAVENCNNTEKLPLDIIVKDISNTALFKYTLSGCLPDRVKFQWDSTNAGDYHFNKWLWTFPDNTTAVTDTASKLFAAAGIYPVQLNVISEEGCIDDTTIDAIVPEEMACAQPPGSVKVPNAFSPNGDGINDTWEIHNLYGYPTNTVEIFNRYGQRVFYSRGYDKPWDGGGLPLGVYYYVIDLRNGSRKLAGYVTLLK
jgi:gliding motility-associated-like protein